MSKAFTRESDDLPERPLPPRSAVAPGASRSLTASGARHLQEELERLTQLQNSIHTPVEDSVKSEHQTRAQRILQLQQILASAVVVPPPAQPWEQVMFGATVTVREPSGVEAKYRIVGVDETDLDQNRISPQAPIARALLKAKLGQRIQFRAPAGIQEWEIVGITYE